MNTFIRKIIFLLSLFNLSNSLYSSEILECNYHFSSYDSDSTMVLTIDGYKYRETVCKANTYTDNTCYFALPVNSRDLNVSYIIDGYSNNIPYLSCNYHRGFIISEKLGYQDKLIKNKLVPLLQMEYYYPKKHILKIATLISLRPLDLKQSNAYLQLFYNNELKHEDIIYSDYPSASHKLELYGYNGYNNIDLMIQTLGTWCSCPSIGNGYENNRYFLAWITDTEEKQNIYINDNKYIEISIGNPNIISI